jgi:hypothetical protein
MTRRRTILRGILLLAALLVAADLYVRWDADRPAERGYKVDDAAPQY